MKLITGIALVVLAAVVVIVGVQRFGGERVELPSGETTTETVEITSMDENNTQKDTVDTPKSQPVTREVFVTDGVRHTIPIDEIVDGGPPKDGIPSIDDPKFISVREASNLMGDEEPGIALSIGNTNRFYPFQILVWHEIVNDTIDGKRVLVTYCPLCFSGVVFDPIVEGERVEFGVSGKLWENNLLMYDRKTDSLWSQIFGEAVLGEAVSAALPRIPSDIVKFGPWKKLNHEGEVLSRETGATRFYGTDPYGSYYTQPGTVFPSRGTSDTRLEQKDFILGIVIDGHAKAYYPPAIKAEGEVEDTFQDTTLVLRHETDLDIVRVFRKKTDGTLERINPMPSFWFSWAAAYPNTELYK